MEALSAQVQKRCRVTGDTEIKIHMIKEQSQGAYDPQAHLPFV